MAPALSDRDAPPMEPEGFLREPDMDFLGEDVILQAVMKNLSGDAIFPLLEEEVAREEAAQRVQQMRLRLERRVDFLLRRLRLRQVRAQGEHAAEELRSAFAPALDSAPEPPTRQAARNLLKRLESSIALPNRTDTIQAPGPSATSSAAPLRAQLSIVEHQLDSDATESSSGAESADELVPYQNPHQARLPITKRAMWKWAQERASIASRWTWLQAQIQELEYKIKQHGELQRKVRMAKGANLLCEPSGYTGPLPGSAAAPEDDETCARMRPLNRTTFRKRKLLQMHNLHTATEKAAKPSNIRCICQWPLGGCAVCTGRVLPMHPLPYTSTLTRQERLALVDPAYHPVLSSNKEISTSVQYSAKMKIPNWQQKCTLKMFKGNSVGGGQAAASSPAKPSAGSLSTQSKLIASNKSHSKKKKSKSKRSDRPRDMMNMMKRRISVQDMIKKESDLGSPQAPYPSGSSSPVMSPSDHRHRPRMERSRLNSSYDIDNIVIPHSIAASTKLEILQYKEILTPKWRTIEPEEVQPSNNGLIRKSLPSTDEKDDAEDVCETTIVARHERCEQLEKGKYLQKRKSSRRQNSRSGTGSNPPLTPSETPPHTPATIIDETSTHSESAMSNTTVQTSLMNISAATTAPPSSISTAPSSSTSTAEQQQFSASLFQSHSSSSHKRRPTLQMDEVEVIPPYSPRDFPLTDEEVNRLLMMMPESQAMAVDDPNVPHASESCTIGSDSESLGAITYCVPVDAVVEGPQAHMASDSDGDSCPPMEEDPNDPEWNVSVHAD